jgi:hypothetical protein
MLINTKKKVMTKNTISNKTLTTMLSQQTVTNETGYSSFTTDTKEMNFSASLEFTDGTFNCSMWIGESEDETELTEKQKDTVFYFLADAATDDLEFQEIDKEHALTLIYS